MSTENLGEYRGYNIRWTGWKGPATNGKMYGQLLAHAQALLGVDHDSTLAAGDHLEMNLQQGVTTPQSAMPQFHKLIDKWTDKRQQLAA